VDSASQPDRRRGQLVRRRLVPGWEAEGRMQPRKRRSAHIRRPRIAIRKRVHDIRLLSNVVELDVRAITTAARCDVPFVTGRRGVVETYAEGLVPAD
jgi:hypothetical protein